MASGDRAKISFAFGKAAQPRKAVAGFDGCAAKAASGDNGLGDRPASSSSGGRAAEASGASTTKVQVDSTAASHDRGGQAVAQGSNSQKTDADKSLEEKGFLDFDLLTSRLWLCVDEDAALLARLRERAATLTEPAAAAGTDRSGCTIAKPDLLGALDGEIQAAEARLQRLRLARNKALLMKLDGSSSEPTCQEHGSSSLGDLTALMGGLKLHHDGKSNDDGKSNEKICNADDTTTLNTGPRLRRRRRCFCVLDTNALLDELRAVEEIRKLGICKLVVPYRVVQELDGVQKDLDDAKAKKARDATRYLESSSEQSSHLQIRFQKSDGSETVEIRSRMRNADDEILACARYFSDLDGSLPEELEAEEGQFNGVRELSGVFREKTSSSGSSSCSRSSGGGPPETGAAVTTHTTFLLTCDKNLLLKCRAANASAANAPTRGKLGVLKALSPGELLTRLLRDCPKVEEPMTAERIAESLAGLAEERKGSRRAQQANGSYPQAGLWQFEKNTGRGQPGRKSRETRNDGEGGAPDWQAAWGASKERG